MPLSREDNSMLYHENAEYDDPYGNDIRLYQELQETIKREEKEHMLHNEKFGQTLKEQIEKDYRIVDGRIVSPGKYENEQAYVAYFHLLSLDGIGEIIALGENGTVTEIEIDIDDMEIYPCLEPYHSICIIEDSTGFVYGVLYKQ
jgi:hypothetical protein